MCATSTGSRSLLLSGVNALVGDDFEVGSNSDILIEDGIIGSISEHGTVSSPGVRVLDLQGMFVLPGLIDCHVHFNLRAEETSSGLYQSSTHSGFDGILAGLKNGREWIAAGITSVRDCGGFDHANLSLRTAYERGDFRGPRVRTAAMTIGCTGGHFVGRVADGEAAVLQAVREQALAGADFVKLMTTGGLGVGEFTAQHQEMSPREIEAAVGEARRRGLFVAAHAHAEAAIFDAVRAGVRSLEHGTELNEEAAELMAQQGTSIVPTFAPYVRMANAGGLLPDSLVDAARWVLETKERTFALCLEYGVPVVAGTDSGAPNNPIKGALALEVSELARHGLSARQALQAATVRAAELMQLERLGSLQEGYIADLVIVGENPLDELDALQDVMTVIQNGMVVDTVDSSDGS